MVLRSVEELLERDASLFVLFFGRRLKNESVVPEPRATANKVRNPRKHGWVESNILAMSAWPWRISTCMTKRQPFFL